MAKGATKRPWIDRNDLLKDIRRFIARHKGFFSQYAKRMSDLFEMSVYNDIVRFYKQKNYKASIKNLGKGGTFRYKLSPAGLAKNFSYFKVSKTSGQGKKKKTLRWEIHHNIKVQSFHDAHIYFTADVSVTPPSGVTTVKQRSGRRHSFVENTNLITLAEAKNLNPFPEILLGFTGILLETLPEFIHGSVDTSEDIHLSPSIVFSGSTSSHVQYVCGSLESRYQLNVFTHLSNNKGKVLSFKTANRFKCR